MSLLLRGCVELRGKTPSSRAQLDNYRKHCRQDRSPTRPGDGRLAEGNLGLSIGKGMLPERRALEMAFLWKGMA
jgi:hypothetical protein